MISENQATNEDMEMLKKLEYLMDGCDQIYHRTKDLPRNGLLKGSHILSLLLQAEKSYKLDPSDKEVIQEEYMELGKRNKIQCNVVKLLNPKKMIKEQNLNIDMGKEEMVHLEKMIINMGPTIQIIMNMRRIAKFKFNLLRDDKLKFEDYSAFTLCIPKCLLCSKSIPTPQKFEIALDIIRNALDREEPRSSSEMEPEGCEESILPQSYTQELIEITLNSIEEDLKMKSEEEYKSWSTFIKVSH